MTISINVPMPAHQSDCKNCPLGPKNGDCGFACSNLPSCPLSSPLVEDIEPNYGSISSNDDSIPF